MIELEIAASIDDLESKLGVSFNDRGLLVRAMTHESFANEWSLEHPNSNSEVESYERLEYLGDAVLSYAVAHELFANATDADEGELSIGRASIVCRDSLAEAARRLSLEPHILLGKGETEYSSIVRESVLEDAFEAVVGAIHVDQGYDAARAFVMTQLGEMIGNVIADGVEKDPKSAFQELVQGAGLKTPSYRTQETGTDRSGQTMFRSKVSVLNRVVAEGEGTSKSRAEKTAAANAKTKFERGIPATLLVQEASNAGVMALRSEVDYRNRKYGTRGESPSALRKLKAWLSRPTLRDRQTQGRRRILIKRPD